MPTVVISQDEVGRLLPMDACIDLMAEALVALTRGEALLPLRSMLRLPQSPNIFATMPAFSAPAKTVGVKVLTVFPGNHGTENDSHQGAVLIFETEHGTLQAVIDATAITMIRTAAVSALATRLLARDDATELAILGSGAQAKSHLEAIPLVRTIERVRVWSRDSEHARSLAELAEERGLPAVVSATVEQAVRGAHIVCTVTSSTEPILEGAWLSPGTHINAVGACTPNARELDTAAVVKGRVFVDRRESALAEPGDLLIPIKEGAIEKSHIVAELGELVAGTAQGRRSRDEITIFESLGIAVEDLAAARYVHRAALNEGLGTTVELGGRRHARA
jgi:ornithine cyclodeaminase/alanine dehydrogenase-like protein (mu-crystallin family)